jgi:hypothetical protein
MVEGKSWSLVWEWGSFATVISGAPSTSFTESGSSAFPGLGALLGTHPVVGLGDGAVLVIGSGLSVGVPVTLPEFFTVIVGFGGGWDVTVGESDGWWSGIEGNILVMSSLSSGEESDEGDEFHYK